MLATGRRLGHEGPRLQHTAGWVFLRALGGYWLRQAFSDVHLHYE